ncbi:MAG: RcnB family protein [Sphingomonadales bacterium]|nr:RcnB family protein [Sphingomonadales bacterium]
MPCCWRRASRPSPPRPRPAPSTRWRRDLRQDRRAERRWDRREARRDYRDWNRSWRNDRRYDWRDHRNRYRSVYRPSVRYYAPYRGHRYSRLSIGIHLGSGFFGSRYLISDPWRYRLPPHRGYLRWIRYYDDVLLVDTRSGYVVDVIYDFFW